MTNNIHPTLNLDANLDNAYSVNKSFAYSQYGIEPSIFSIFEPDNLEMSIKTKFINDIIEKSKILNKKFANELPIKLNTKHIHQMRDSIFIEYPCNDGNTPMYIYISYAEAIDNTLYLIANKKLPRIINVSINIYYNHTIQSHLTELENLINTFNKSLTSAIILRVNIVLPIPGVE